MIALLLQLPAGKAYLLHRHKTVPPQAVQPPRCTHVGAVAQEGDTQHLAPQPFGGGETGIYGRYGHGENAIVGDSPEQTVAVVGQAVHIVGAKAVILIYATQLIALTVNAIGGHGTHTAIKIHCLGDMGGRKRRAVRRGGGVAGCRGDGAVGQHVAGIVAHLHIHGAVGFPDTGHLATDRLAAADAGEAENAMPVGLQPADEVVATRPQPPPRVAIEHGDAGDSRRVDNAPAGVVVVKESLKIGSKDRSVIGDRNVEILVVGTVFRSGIVTEIGNPLCLCRLAAKEEE